MGSLEATGARRLLCFQTAAYLVLLVEALLLLLSLVVLPLTVISFDVSSLVTIIANGGSLLLALVALCRPRHKYLWPFMVVKVSSLQKK